jgi:hypothetical protein
MPQIPGAPVALEETAQTLPMRLLSFYHLTQTFNLKRAFLLCLISPVLIKVLKYYVLVQIQVASTQKVGIDYKVIRRLTITAAFCL